MSLKVSEILNEELARKAEASWTVLRSSRIVMMPKARMGSLTASGTRGQAWVMGLLLLAQVVLRFPASGTSFATSPEPRPHSITTVQHWVPLALVRVVRCPEDGKAGHTRESAAALAESGSQAQPRLRAGAANSGVASRARLASPPKSASPRGPPHLT